MNVEKEVGKMKTTYQTNYSYQVYHYPTARTYYFDWRPSKKDLIILAEKEGHDDPNLDDYYIDKIDFENPYKYGRKLRC